MTEQEEIPVHDGPDAHEWPEVAPRMWGLVLDLEHLDRIIAALDGPVPAGYARVHGEARNFLDEGRRGTRGELAEMILRAYKVPLPEEPADLPTEAVGGFRGDSNGPGDRDHV